MALLAAFAEADIIFTSTERVSENKELTNDLPQQFDNMLPEVLHIHSYFVVRC